MNEQEQATLSALAQTQAQQLAPEEMEVVGAVVTGGLASEETVKLATAQAVEHLPPMESTDGPVIALGTVDAGALAAQKEAAAKAAEEASLAEKARQEQEAAQAAWEWEKAQALAKAQEAAVQSVEEHPELVTVAVVVRRRPRNRPAGSV